MGSVTPFMGPETPFKGSVTPPSVWPETLSGTALRGVCAPCVGLKH